MPTTYHIDEQRFRAAPTIESYIDAAQKNQEFWRGVYRTARVPDDLAARARAVPGEWNLLALSEDWCGDAVNSIPVIARLAEVIPGARFHLLGRDANPDLMDEHRTRGTRSIPVVMIFDHAFIEQGWWGPRPGVLQQWFLDEGTLLEKPDRSRRARECYARDRGRSAQQEVLALVESAAATA
jgi:hypothetical protein